MAILAIKSMTRKSLSSIVIVIERFFPLVGGTETQSLQLAESLSVKGIKVMVITRRFRKDLSQQEVFSGKFEIVRLGPSRGGRLASYLSGFSLAIFLWKRRKFGDLILVNGGLANIFGSTAVLIGKLMKKKVIARVATPGELFFSGPLSLSPKKFVHPLIKLRLLMVKTADYFIAQTKQIKKEIILFGVKKEKIRVIPDGVDEKKFGPAILAEKKRLKEKLDFPPEKIIVIYCGRLVKRKGLVFLLRAWNDVVARDKKTALVLIGSGRNQPDSVEKLLWEMAGDNLNKNVFFLGEKDKSQVPLYLRASDVFVYPSILSEGTSFSVLEAMSCGLPVISCRVGGVDEVVRNKNSGILVKKEDVNSLSSALLLLINDSILREKLGKKARLEIEKKYTLSCMTERYYKFFNQVLNE